MTDAAPREDVPDAPGNEGASARAADAPPEPSPSSGEPPRSAPAAPGESSSEQAAEPADEVPAGDFAALVASAAHAASSPQFVTPTAQSAVNGQDRPAEPARPEPPAQPEQSAAPARTSEPGQSIPLAQAPELGHPVQLTQTPELGHSGASAQTPEPGQPAPPAQASEPGQATDSDQPTTSDQPTDQTKPPAPGQPAVPWSADQPAPAPWFLGRPGQTPPPGWPAAPPPPRNTPPYGSGQAPRPPYGPPPGAQPGPPPGGQPGAPAGPRPGDPAGQQSGRPPGQPPDRRSGPRQQPPREPVRPGEQPKRPQLSLKTRWARGLALGGATCTLLAVLYGYQTFPAWLVGAGAGLALALTGLWFGAFAQREAAQQGQRAPEAIASIVWCVISSVISLGIIAISLALYPQLHQYSRCVQTANTVSQQNACVQQLKQTWPFTESTAGSPSGQ